MIDPQRRRESVWGMVAWNDPFIWMNLIKLNAYFHYNYLYKIENLITRMYVSQNKLYYNNKIMSIFLGKRLSERVIL